MHPADRVKPRHRVRHVGTLLHAPADHQTWTTTVCHLTGPQRMPRQHRPRPATAYDSGDEAYKRVIFQRKTMSRLTPTTDTNGYGHDWTRTDAPSAPSQ